MHADLDRISKYRIIAKIGEGGMASVHLGVMCGPSQFTKLVVVKVLRPDLAADDHIVSMFQDEARIAARLNHANVVDTYEVGHDENRHFIAMEYLQGQPFSAVIRRIGREEFSLAVQLKVLSDVLEGLHYVHELRDFDGSRLDLVHRDVSPQNVFIHYDGQVKLVDFGIAKAACSGADTRAGVVKGKISYLAPEQARGGIVDHRADLFAVGVMLWEALAGRKFTFGQIDAATIHKRIHGLEPRIRDVEPDVPSMLARICDRALDLDPEARFASAAEFQHAIDAYREEAGHRVEPREVGRLVAMAFARERMQIERVIEANTSAAAMSVFPDDLITSKSVIAVPDEDNDSEKAAPRLRAWGPMAAVGTLVVLGAVFYLGHSAGRSRVSEPTSPESSAFASALEPEPAPAASQVRLRIHVHPESAVIRLDGRQLERNPHDGRHPRDDREHRVEASAAGFETEVRDVVLDCDTHLEIELHPDLAQSRSSDTRPVAANPNAFEPPAPPPPSAGDDLRKLPGHEEPHRSIDPADPYR